MPDINSVKYNLYCKCLNDTIDDYRLLPLYGIEKAVISCTAISSMGDYCISYCYSLQLYYVSVQ